ncbi:hypothetical protein BMETH_2841_0 [methanotrophic bacterial endosymbiont of Bathymodiolus sp.]|nr:hypothetical protein BMETH_2841_0 [methanotrophic bacterial endosymbiont of Bathymodiolus sp.]
MSKHISLKDQTMGCAFIFTNVFKRSRILLEINLSM